MERLNKFLASCGVASRRGADLLIGSGRVFVNGKPVYELGISVDEDKDRVEVDGQRVRPSSDKVYLLLNKLPGYVSTRSDPLGRRTVFDLLPRMRERVFSVGRLDYDAAGLLLLTNDGDLTNFLTHPRYEVSKTYQTWVRGRVPPDALRRLVKGVALEDGPAKAQSARLIRHAEGESLIEIVLQEGRNREVKRLCEAVGHPVKRLFRIALGDLRLGSLAPGKWRKLTPKEVQGLYKSRKG